MIVHQAARCLGAGELDNAVISEPQEGPASAWAAPVARHKVHELLFEHPFGHAARRDAEVAQQTARRNLHQAAPLDERLHSFGHAGQCGMTFRTRDNDSNSATLERFREFFELGRGLRGDFHEQMPALVRKRYQVAADEAFGQIQIQLHGGSGMHVQVDAARGKYLAQVLRPCSNQFAPYMAVAAKLMSGSDDRPDPIGTRQACHFNGFLPAPRAVIHAGKQVTMNVNQVLWLVHGNVQHSGPGLRSHPWPRRTGALSRRGV